MKKLTFTTLAIIILFSAHQVGAANDKSNEKAQNNPSVEKKNENSHKQTENAEIQETEGEVSVTPSEASPSPVWKNHGQYVKSVAATHPGGSVVSEAARSSIGKKGSTTITPSISPSISPSVSPTVTPSVTVSPTPTDDPTATPSPTVSVTPTGTPGQQHIATLIETLENLIDTLKGIFNL